MLGVIIGSVIASTALVIATWQRQPWSRYVLLALLWGVVLVFCIPLLGLTVSKDEVTRTTVASLLGGVGLYLLVILMYTISKPLQRLTKTDAS
jgi:Na+/phosphate symporter